MRDDRERRLACCQLAIGAFARTADMKTLRAACACMEPADLDELIHTLQATPDEEVPDATSRLHVVIMAKRTAEETRWPEPETEEPDLETLQDWDFEGVCEASDGCIVEPDGICPHGHPSWLLRLGLI